MSKQFMKDLLLDSIGVMLLQVVVGHLVTVGSKRLYWVAASVLLFYCCETDALLWGVITNLYEMGGCPLAVLFNIQLYREPFFFFFVALGINVSYVKTVNFLNSGTSSANEPKVSGALSNFFLVWQEFEITNRKPKVWNHNKHICWYGLLFSHKQA